MEELLVPVMFDLPDREDVTRVVINAAVVRGEADPEYVTEAKSEGKTA